MATISVAQAQSYAQAAGFSGNSLNIIVGIAQAESGLDTSARGTNTDGSLDRGILQINNRWHPEVSDSCAYNPACAFQQGYRISNKGTNFNAWATYTSGKYRQFTGGSGSSAPTVKAGDGNNYPLGQCTWWADERYHQLTGYYNPWNHTGQGNANQWLQRAKDYGWNTDTKPPKGIPSIICLQGFTQGATSSLGHVAIVEKVNSDGSVLTSNMNWRAGQPFSTNLNTGGYPVTQVTFRQGTGVSFLWAGGGALSNNGSGEGGATTYTPLLEQVHETLVNVPGFYGMALALNELEKFPGWINLVDPSQTAFGVNFDVVGWIRSLGATCTDNFAPFAVRAMLVSLGIFILLMLVVKIVLEVGDKAVPIIRTIGA